MKNIAIAFLAALTGACTVHSTRQGPPRSESYRRAAESDWKKESVILYVWLDGRDGRCKLRERIPGEIRAESGSEVRWIIEGSCEGKHTISVDRRLKRGGVLKDLFVGSNPIETGASDGESMSGTVRKIEESEKGLYKYRIFIDGQPAHYNSYADDGNFEVCPDWPC